MDIEDQTKVKWFPLIHVFIIIWYWVMLTFHYGYSFFGFYGNP